MSRGVADLEAIGEALGIESWIVLGHLWRCDLGVRYAVDRPQAVWVWVDMDSTTTTAGAQSTRPVGPQRDSAALRHGRVVTLQPLSQRTAVWVA